MKNQVVSEFLSYSDGIRDVVNNTSDLSELFAAHSAYACSFTEMFKRIQGDYESEHIRCMLDEFNEVNEIFEHNIIERGKELMDEALAMIFMEDCDAMYEGTEYEQDSEEL